MTTITFTHCDIRPHRRVVDATVTTGRGVHRVGHLPGEGWFCYCTRTFTCPHIATIRALVPAIDRQETPA